jgi:hypothetical protein
MFTRDYMKKWIAGLYVVASLALTFGIVAGAWLIFFVNPINWKNYTDYRGTDYFIMWGSNGLIVVVGVGLIAATWRLLWKLAKRMAKPAGVNTSNHPTPPPS